MITTFSEAVQYIENRQNLGIQVGLSRVESLLEAIGNPHHQTKFIHLAGTNGKGSTLQYLNSILTEAGYKTGTFTSPFIESITEQIAINGMPITDEDFVVILQELQPVIEKMDVENNGPTTFEIYTVMAFLYFKKQQVDIALVECGLGGLEDSTNVLTPLISIITNVGFDHIAFLGTTLKEIASAKAGIIKKGISTLSAVNQPEAKEVILNRSNELNAPSYFLYEDFTMADHVSIPNGERFTWISKDYSLQDLVISMYGKHQTENAALAIMATFLLQKEHGFHVNEQHIRKGLEKTYWPGRFEIVTHNPMLILDGAHNEEGVASLTAELSKRYHNKKIKIIFSALADKKLDEMIRRLDQVADEITFVSFDYPRATSAQVLFDHSGSAHKKMNNDWKQSLTIEYKSVKENEILVVTGSLYFISQVKHFLRETML